MTRIVALNIRAGGGARAGALLAWLDGHDPDIVMLSEWRDGPAGARIQAWAQARGMQHAGLNDGATANGVFVASRSRFVCASETPAGQCAGVLMLSRFAAFSMLACYFPIMREKSRFFARCAEVAAEHAKTPFLLLGDMNTGDQLADRDPRGVRYHCAADFCRLTEDCGLHDLWRRSHGADAREWTWLSHRANGFRIDHAFGNAAFVDIAGPDCRYDHAPRERRITDHSAVILTCATGLA